MPNADREDVPRTRLFFALVPGPAACAELTAAARAVLDVALPVGQGRAVAPESLHLTLAFIGELDAAQAAQAAAAADRLELTPFEIVIDQTGCFADARAWWLGSSRPPAELLNLRRDLVEGLFRNGIDVRSAPFVPHVTIAHKTPAPLPEQPTTPIRWSVADFALVRSERDVAGVSRYEVVARWGHRPHSDAPLSTDSPATSRMRPRRR